MLKTDRDPVSLPPPFPTDARSVVSVLRRAFLEPIVALGADPNSGPSIAAALGINRNLGWKLSRIVQSDDPAAVFQQMPGAGGVQILIKSLEGADLSPELVEAAKNAIDEYERLIRVHSGDRSALEMMGSALSPTGRKQRDEYHRKLLFQGASYVWGVQARVNLKLGVVAPGAEPGMLDFASLNALLDFRRIRPDVTWIMASRRSRNDDGTVMATQASEVLDERYAGAEQAPLVEDLCSKPLPEFRRYEEGGWTRFELVEGRVGNTGALDCVLGTIQRQIPYYRTPANEWGVHQAKSDIPAELMLIDVFFHRDLEFAFSPEAVLYSEAAVMLPEPQRERYRLPLSETLQDLGMTGLPPVTPEVPQYPQIMAKVYERTGWSPADFRGIRMKIAYPAYPTALVLRYKLPPAPDEVTSST
ncbi:MAG: hypothetical protein ACF8NJ_04495 [Phycisphaerales bacterium JB038]